MAPTVEFSALPATILGEAAKVGGNTWSKIQGAMKIYVNGYLSSLRDIAQSVVDGEISKEDAAMYADNSKFMFSQAIANTSHIILTEVQNFINKIISLLTDTINKALPMPIL